jgi:hypothetical protein
MARFLGQLAELVVRDTEEIAAAVSSSGDAFHPRLSVASDAIRVTVAIEAPSYRPRFSANSCSWRSSWRRA